MYPRDGVLGDPHTDDDQGRSALAESEFDPQSAIGRRLTLPEFPDAVTLEGLDDWDDVLLLRVRTARGELKEAQIERAELARLTAAAPATTAALVDPDDLFLLAESVRIRHAYAWDPHFAVSMSGIEPLPHQLEAVYERMLPQSRLRFLLADDPGAGKTIMAGLLLKELRLRGAVERTLVLAPAPLALQWQDELRSKFDEVFQLVDAHAVKQQLGGSPWKQFNQCVASMDFAKRDEIAPDLLRERWDLVIIDEAHKVSTPDTDHPTQRYRLARALTERTEALLLLTATPHQGNPAQFQTLLGLLDPDIFSSDEMVKRLLGEDQSPWILRRMKEDLRDFRGARLFVKRHAYTEDFNLNTHEYALYEAVTEYINRYLRAPSGRRKRSAALARMVLQRRLASSLRAIRTSLENRHKRLRETLDALAGMSSADRTRRLRALADLPVDPELDTDDESEDELEEIAERALVAERYEHLVEEVDALAVLVSQAIETEERGEESKLDKLFECLAHSEMKALEEENGKLIIFTEQRATLDYLRAKLEGKGYTCCEIHGGMSAINRKEAQEDFRLRKQICIATDAAGEGINLQFCHLMINYDMPWNPMRLEQRMGRIHRFGQTRECHIFNFVAIGGPLGAIAQPVIEGRVLFRLMEKLEEIRDSLHDRVFDVIGLLLRTNGINLEDIIRDATYNPGRLADYEDQIERISKERLDAYEQATGIALAKKTIDLSRIRGADFESQERRLMPEYVEDQFLAAAARTGLRVERRANPALLRIETVPLKFVARNLVAVRERGLADRQYRKASFHKRELMKPENQDGALLSPGHPLYAAVDELLRLGLRGAVGGTARALDPHADHPYRLHLFEMELEGETLGDPGEPPRTRPVYARLVIVHEYPDGTCAEAPSDLLHDLTPVAPEQPFPDCGPLGEPLSPDALGKVQGWVKVRVQFPLVKDQQSERKGEIEIRRKYLTSAFAASLRHAQARQYALHVRVLQGEEGATLARDEAQKRAEELASIRDHRLRSLDHMAVVRPGPVAHLGSLIVAPAPLEGDDEDALHTDEDIEAIAMALAMAHEKARGWTVEDVSKRNDGCGFDLRSVSPPDEHDVRAVRRIEVKGRSRRHGAVHLSPNEWRKAQRLSETYWLYVVWGCATDDPVLKTIHDPWHQLRGAAQEVIGVKSYRIPGAALKQADGQEWRA